MLPLTRNIASLFKPTGIYTRFASTKKIFVGNLPWGARNEDLSSLFGEYGQVVSARVITDRNTGRSRGFGFVEMDDQAAEKAIEGLNGTNFKGRDIRVSFCCKAFEVPYSRLGALLTHCSAPM